MSLDSAELCIVDVEVLNSLLRCLASGLQIVMPAAERLEIGKAVVIASSNVVNVRRLLGAAASVGILPAASR